MSKDDKVRERSALCCCAGCCWLPSVPSAAAGASDADGRRECHAAAASHHHNHLGVVLLSLIALPSFRACSLPLPAPKVERLNKLLDKSIAYSEFLANKIKEEGAEGTVKVADGAVAGTGLAQPKLVKGEMRPYQLIGVHWLVGLYENGLNGILGDEMGLGKTVQSISMLAHLTEQGVTGPFMVVGPLSTLHNWANEFKKWCALEAAAERAPHSARRSATAHPQPRPHPLTPRRAPFALACLRALQDA